MQNARAQPCARTIQLLSYVGSIEALLSLAVLTLTCSEFVFSPCTTMWRWCCLLAPICTLAARYDDVAMMHFWKDFYANIGVIYIYITFSISARPLHACGAHRMLHNCMCANYKFRSRVRGPSYAIHRGSASLIASHDAHYLSRWLSYIIADLLDDHAMAMRASTLITLDDWLDDY
jgi:hypothetical protein